MTNNNTNIYPIENDAQWRERHNKEVYRQWEQEANKQEEETARRRRNDRLQ